MILIGIAAHHVVNACTSASWLINVAVLPSAIFLTSIILKYSSPFSVNIDSLPPILLFPELAVGVDGVFCWFLQCICRRLDYTKRRYKLELIFRLHLFAERCALMCWFCSTSAVFSIQEEGSRRSYNCLSARDTGDKFRLNSQSGHLCGHFIPDNPIYI